jgi:hypothetical protein
VSRGVVYTNAPTRIIARKAIIPYTSVRENWAAAMYIRLLRSLHTNPHARRGWIRHRVDLRRIKISAWGHAMRC